MIAQQKYKIQQKKQRFKQKQNTHTPEPIKLKQTKKKTKRNGQRHIIQHAYFLSDEFVFRRSSNWPNHHHIGDIHYLAPASVSGLVCVMCMNDIFTMCNTKTHNEKSK